MAKAITGLEYLGGAVALGATAFALAATGVGIAALPAIETVMTGLAFSGISMEAGAIADALTANRGMNITTRQPAAFRQVIYGEQRVGGVMIYSSTTGSHHDQYNMVIVIAGHVTDSIVNLYLDGRQVYWNQGSFGNTTRNGVNFGGDSDSNDHIGPDGQKYNFGGKVFCEARYGDQGQGDVLSSLRANDPTWATGANGSPWVGGCTYVYLKVEYSPSQFPQRPEVKFTVRGKSDIFDPRTGGRGYSTNWALIVADVISDTQFGLGDNTVNQAQLIAAANVCDEQVALGKGGSEARYSCHYHYDCGSAPGNVLATMMPAACGRLSRIGGEWYIWPAYWQGPSFTFGLGDVVAGIDSFETSRSYSQLYNRVTGTYIAPNYPYNVAGNLYDANGWYNGAIQNNFPFAFQPTNYPMYACDFLHGYASDEFLNEDGGQPLSMEMTQECVLSISQAQRCAKIALLRNRQQGSGTLQMRIGAWKMQPIDVFTFNYPLMGSSSGTTLLEVTGTNFKIDTQGEDGAARVYVEFSVQTTLQSVYEWSAAEELSVYDVPAAPYLQAPREPAPPTNVAAFSNAATALQTSDGIVASRIIVTWDTPLDILITQIQVRYQRVGDSTWIDGVTVSVSNNQALISSIYGSTNYNVQVRSIRANGATSVWVGTSLQSSAINTSLTSNSLVPNSPFNTSNNAIIDSVVGIVGGGQKVANIRLYGPGGDGSNFNRIVGLTFVPMTSVHYVGFAFGTQYFLAYNTQNNTYVIDTIYNNLLPDFYFFIGSIVTLNNDGTGGFHGGGGGVQGGGRLPITTRSA